MLDYSYLPYTITPNPSIPYSGISSQETMETVV